MRDLKDNLMKLCFFIGTCLLVCVIFAVFLYLVFWIFFSSCSGRIILPPFDKDAPLYAKLQDTICYVIPLASCLCGIITTIIIACGFKLFDIRQTGK